MASSSDKSSLPLGKCEGGSRSDPARRSVVTMELLLQLLPPPPPLLLFPSRVLTVGGCFLGATGLDFRLLPLFEGFNFGEASGVALFLDRPSNLFIAASMVNGGFRCGLGITNVDKRVCFRTSSSSLGSSESSSGDSLPSSSQHSVVESALRMSSEEDRGTLLSLDVMERVGGVLTS